MLGVYFVLFCFLIYIGWVSVHGLRDMKRHREIARLIPFRTLPGKALREKILVDLNYKYKMEEALMEQADLPKLERYKQAIEFLERSDPRSVFLINDIYA
ncbi:hypothetical protein [Paenibacillus spongiae]|uniref:Uncharacterized protein n=1 Tax=Paenibacillus spongiae TaxID=2909671 RepID=A0ABY5S6J1_9BACL|nr:hypothetical protein [Paenibacillus spongiae]UVI29522.1 hypothetical protein L1F29_29570 [Paenibacillus spongiae]